MSASTERKNRLAAREAGTDKKLLAQQEEAKKKAVSRRRWILGTIGVVLLIAFILLINSSLPYTATTAATIDGQRYSPAEVSYYYTTQYMNFANQYGSYASIFGLDTSNGKAGLASQSCPMLEDGTWRDYFLQMAYTEMGQMQGLLAYAKENGVSLTEEEIAAVDESLAGIDSAAALYGYASANRYLAANYGQGVTKKLVRACALNEELANKAYNAYRDSLDYSSEELEETYAGYEGERDLFDYAVYTVDAAVAEGEEAPSDLAKMEAKADADAILAAYQDGSEIEDAVERLNAYLEETYGETAAVSTRVSGSSLNSLYKEWLKGSRAAGDAAVFAGEDGSSYSVVLFLGRDDNHYKTANVRHILIQAEADEDGAWTDEALEAAKAEAERILAEWKAGEATEESFAALAEEYSDDAGSNTNGGLYENVYKGQTVEEFDAFCFADHKSGDTAVVYGTNGNYAGYHVMYYVGEGELYSEVIARSDLTNEATTEWLDSITGEARTTFWERYVG